MIQIEFDFTLPCGYSDDQGNLHREGVMRRATARDELEVLSHPQVRAHEIYTSVFLLSRVITRLGALREVSPVLVEQLFSVDFAYLQELYLRVNGTPPQLIETACPACGTHIVLDISVNERPAET